MMIEPVEEPIWSLCDCRRDTVQWCVVYPEVVTLKNQGAPTTCTLQFYRVDFSPAILVIYVKY